MTQLDNQKKGFENIKTPEKFRDYLLSKALTLVGHYAGSEFASAARVCLERRDWESLDEWEIQEVVRADVLARLNKLA